MVTKAFVNQYSALDRLLHKVAFSSPGAQVALADIEDRLHAQQLNEIPITRPVFITALPRAGTTILLNLLYDSGAFTTHTYRSMPFVLCPLIWRRLSSLLRSDKRIEMERAHGDGISISVDSPEAFEEIIWHHFWPENYADDRITPWHTAQNAEFVEFFRSHIRKLLLLSEGDDHVRYVSKNNLNIARLRYLNETMADGILVVMFRSPLQHAASLLKQHLNFQQAHREDSFAKQYMRGIGHFDFGDNLLPVNFDNWLEKGNRPDPATLEFWLAYWVASYRNILETAGDFVHLLSFENLTEDPRSSLQKLADTLRMANPERLTDQYGALRNAALHPVDTSNLPQSLLKSAHDVHQELLARPQLL
jgi:hypothetical protein